MVAASKQAHFRTSNGKRRIAEQIYREVYAGAPMPFLLMTPEFEILDANDAYLTATMRLRDSLAGCDMFEAFPDNPELDEANGVANLTQSLIQARSTGRRQAMAVQRYDVVDPNGIWRLRYWQPVNWPVLDEKGSILAIVHHVSNVTSEVLARQAAQSNDGMIRHAERICSEARLLQEQTRSAIDLMIRTLPANR